MKISHLCIVFLLFATIFNCARDTPSPKAVMEVEENPDSGEPKESMPEVYFTLNVTEGLDTQSSDDWIFIHNDIGELLDFKSIESGEFVFEMDADKVPEKFTITLFHFRTESANNYRLSTFTEILKGTYWNWQHFSFQNSWNQGDQYGNFLFQVNDFDNKPINAMITNEYGLIDNSISLGSPSGEWGVSGSPSLYDKDDYISSIMTEAGELKYYVFENAKEAGYFNQFLENPLSYKNDYLNFDNLIQIDLPVGNFYFNLKVMGYQVDQEYQRDGFVLSSISSESTAQSLEKVPVGFLDRFENYKVDFILEWDKGNYTYKNQSYGLRPYQIVIPDIPTYSITNNHFQNFNFDTSFDFQWKRDLWVSDQLQDKSMLWNVYSTADYAPLIGELPQEFTSKYSDISLDTMKHFKSELYYNAIEYSEFLDLRYSIVHSTYPYFTHEMMAIRSTND